eukprot:scaffold34656_cov178-Amphora_coffeaeformis.AAC.9
MSVKILIYPRYEYSASFRVKSVIDDDDVYNEVWVRISTTSVGGICHDVILSFCSRCSLVTIGIGSPPITRSATYVYITHCQFVKSCSLRNTKDDRPMPDSHPFCLL